MLINTLFKKYQKINYDAVTGADKDKIMPYSKQVAYLGRFQREPKDDYERSYFKYKCFREFVYYRKKGYILLFNLGSMMILPLLHWKFRKAGTRGSGEEKADAVIENVPRLPNRDFIPQEVTDRYPVIREITEINLLHNHLSDEAEKIYKTVSRRYFFHFYYRIIVLIKLAQFSEYLDRYHPGAIGFYSCEREFSGPLQTLLCERCGSRYIAFMHGDYISTLCFAFQKYSTYYIWDEAYRVMFENLKCDSEMVVYKPRKYSGIADRIRPEDCTFFATYYFSDETEEEARTICRVFKQFEAYGLRTKIRPHPRFSNTEMLSRVFSDIEIEDLSKWSLKESITKSLYIVGLNTTVLSEAYFSGKTVVIDDLSFPERYRELKERGYIMMSRDHLLLSDINGEECKKYNESYAFYKN